MRLVEGSGSCRQMGMDGAVASRILLLPVSQEESLSSLLPSSFAMASCRCLARISPAAPVALITILMREVVLYSAPLQT